MRFLNNLKLLTKLAIPVTLVACVTVGLVVLANSGLGILTRQMHELVDVDATRLSLILKIKAGVNEATIQEKNIIIETRPEETAKFEKTFKEAKQAALADLDSLVALADTP